MANGNVIGAILLGAGILWWVNPGQFSDAVDSRIAEVKDWQHADCVKLPDECIRAKEADTNKLIASLQAMAQKFESRIDMLNSNLASYRTELAQQKKMKEDMLAADAASADDYVQFAGKYISKDDFRSQIILVEDQLSILKFNIKTTQAEVLEMTRMLQTSRTSVTDLKNEMSEYEWQLLLSAARKKIERQTDYEEYKNFVDSK